MALTPEEENEQLKQEIIVLKEDRGMLEREVIEMIVEDIIEKTTKP